jgi:hypothetical protein
MRPEEFYPRSAAREDKRQAFEALGRSFCKTIAEPITNSDSSAKRKLNVSHASGLVDLMMRVPEGERLDSAELRQRLAGTHAERRIVVEVATAKSSGRQVGEVLIIDQAQGMSRQTLREALDQIGGNKQYLARGNAGRNLFGRGLSDVMRAHAQADTHALVESFDGKQLSIAEGYWTGQGYKIRLTSYESPSRNDFVPTHLVPDTSGTAVRFVISSKARAQGCRIPEYPQIVSRLSNFYMLRLIASDPNVRLELRQHRSQGVITDRLEYDFPVGHVIMSRSKLFKFDAASVGLELPPLKVEFLVARTSGKRPLAGSFPDKDARERGLLVIDDLDAVYDLTFADADYEKAPFLEHIYGVVRVNGLRNVLEQYLDADYPTSPLRPDRDGFNKEHEFSHALLDFIAGELRPLYESEKRRLEEKEHGELSTETRRRVDEALKHLNRYFHRITALGGEGSGTDRGEIKAPLGAVQFYPAHTKLIAGRRRRVLLLIRQGAVPNGADVLTTASDGIVVEPENEKLNAKETPRWSAHQEFYALTYIISSSNIGIHGKVTALLEDVNGALLEPEVIIDEVTSEPEIEVPETFEFRPSVSHGSPGRRNNIVLFVNSIVIPPGSSVHFEIASGTKGVSLIDGDGEVCDRLEIRLDAVTHGSTRSNVLRVPIGWRGTAWNQHAHIKATARIGDAVLITSAELNLDEPEDSGFFKDIKYDEIDQEAPSLFAAGVITVNTNDPLNRFIFGVDKTEFDKRVSRNVEAQQRLASLLLEEASFRALEQHREEDKLHFPARQEVTEVHRNIDKYKFESALDVYRALAKR